MVQSVGGLLAGGALTDRRPFRAPHHSASMAALVGGGINAQAGRGVARPSRRALPRRAAGVPAAGAGQPAPAAGDGRGRHRARQPARGLSRPLPARRRDEPLPLRPRHASPAMPAGARRTSAAWRSTSRASPGPFLDRMDLRDRGARRQRGRPAAAAAGRGLRRGGRPRRRRRAAAGARASARSACRTIRTQRRLPAVGRWTSVAAPDAAGAALLRQARRQHAADGARLSPRAARSPAPSPTSTARAEWAASIWPRRCPTAAHGGSAGAA